MKRLMQFLHNPVDAIRPGWAQRFNDIRAPREAIARRGITWLNERDFNTGTDDVMSKKKSKLYTTESNILFHDANGVQLGKNFRWTNKSDIVYGIIGTKPSQNINDIYGPVRPSLNPTNLDAPFSLQWEYEFSPSAIALTFGGDESDSGFDHPPLIRDIITGTFSYKKGLVSGEIRGIASATLKNPFYGSEETVEIWEANSGVRFRGLRSLGQLLGRRFESPLSPSPEFTRVDTTNRSVVDQKGYGSLLSSGWYNTPFTSNLL